MKTLCTAYLAVLLLTLHLSSQVIRAQITTTDSMNTTMNESTVTTAASINITQTTVSPNSGSGITAAFTLLLPLAVASSLLHGFS